MAPHNEIFDKIRKNLRSLSESAKTAAPSVDFMVKMNLPAWMGRRDAVGDRIGELMRGDLFALAEAERRLCYRHVGALLERAIEDTESILMTLTSPDTESRERRQLCCWQMLRQIIGALEILSDLSESLFRAPGKENFYQMLHPDVNFSRDARQLGEGEVNLVGQFRNLFESGQRQMMRYREYAAKNFDKTNAERYQKSYREHHRLFHESRQTDFPDPAPQNP